MKVKWHTYITCVVTVNKRARIGCFISQLSFGFPFRTAVIIWLFGRWRQNRIRIASVTFPIGRIDFRICRRDFQKKESRRHVGNVFFFFIVCVCCVEILLIVCKNGHVGSFDFASIPWLDRSFFDFFSGWKGAAAHGAIEIPLGHFWMEVTFWPVALIWAASLSHLFSLARLLYTTHTHRHTYEKYKRYQRKEKGT